MQLLPIRFALLLVLCTACSAGKRKYYLTPPTTSDSESESPAPANRRHEITDIQWDCLSKAQRYEYCLRRYNLYGTEESIDRKIVWAAASKAEGALPRMRRGGRGPWKFELLIVLLAGASPSGSEFLQRPYGGPVRRERT